MPTPRSPFYVQAPFSVLLLLALMLAGSPSSDALPAKHSYIFRPGPYDTKSFVSFGKPLGEDSQGKPLTHHPGNSNPPKKWGIIAPGR